MTRERKAEPDVYDAAADFEKSLVVAYAAMRARVKAGGSPWVPPRCTCCEALP